ncbi:hypothetical protein EDB83DRAFT_2341920 [Lactarius deliciosus]|nr:hypothetical protein EDB83DRAFT_2341920 [Lactarius deliciosus]
MSARPSHTINPSAPLTAADNASELEPSSYRRPPTLSATPSPPDPAAPEPGPSKLAARTSRKRSPSAQTPNDDLDGIPNSKKAKTNGPHPDPDISGMHSSDVETMGIDGEPLNKTDPTADIKTFFRALPQVPGQAKKRMSCILCAKGLGCVKQDKFLSYEHSTLRRHAASLHSKIKFESMLPNDTRQRREAALDKGAKILQSTITHHFQPENAAEKPIAYSDKAFACAAIEWLIEANLVRISLHRPPNYWAESLYSIGHPSRG